MNINNINIGKQFETNALCVYKRYTHYFGVYFIRYPIEIINSIALTRLKI